MGSRCEALVADCGDGDDDIVDALDGSPSLGEGKDDGEEDDEERRHGEAHKRLDQHRRRRRLFEAHIFGHVIEPVGDIVGDEDDRTLGRVFDGEGGVLHRVGDGGHGVPDARLVHHHLDCARRHILGRVDHRVGRIEDAGAIGQIVRAVANSLDQIRDACPIRDHRRRVDHRGRHASDGTYNTTADSRSDVDGASEGASDEIGGLTRLVRDPRRGRVCYIIGPVAAIARWRRHVAPRRPQRVMRKGAMTCRSPRRFSSRSRVGT